VADLTQVLNNKNKGKLAADLKEMDEARTVTTAVQKQLAAEKESSSSTILALKKEKTSFEAFDREMSWQLLGRNFCAFSFHLFFRGTCLRCRRQVR
jgi:hypothetical protein